MTTSKLMRAIRVSEFGAPSVLKLCTDLPVPSPRQKQVGHLKFQNNIEFFSECFEFSSIFSLES